MLCWKFFCYDIGLGRVVDLIGSIVIGKFEFFFCNLVNIWCVIVFRVIVISVFLVKIVGEDKNDVGWCFWCVGRVFLIVGD